MLVDIDDLGPVEPFKARLLIQCGFYIEAKMMKTTRRFFIRQCHVNAGELTQNRLMTLKPYFDIIIKDETLKMIDK